MKEKKSTTTATYVMCGPLLLARPCKSEGYKSKQLFG
jgi:hypothetical protein